MNDIFPTDRPVHILRLYLPPWRLEERLGEIVRWCAETGTHHVMLFTDAQFMVWNQVNDAEQDEIVATMRTAKARFARDGIRVGVNSSYNMRVSRADQRGHVDFDHWATYADGTTDHRGPCLLDPKLERYLDRFYRRLAAVEPAYIYVDDDHRYMIQGERGTWGCLCNLHLASFARRTGRAWTREGLNAALLGDAGVRREWIACLGERLVELAGLIERAVHAVSPGTKVGMMVPGVHCLPPVGHDLKRVLAALHPGGGKPLVRPCIGGYQDWRRRDLFAGLWYREFVGHWLGPEVEYTSEIECCPGTRLAKSMTVVRYQIAHGLLQGMNVSALSPASYVGDSPFLEPAFPVMLQNNRAFFDAVWRNRPARGSGRGVQLYWNFGSAAATPGPLASVTDLWWPAFNVAEIFGHLGIPTTYDESPLKAFFGDAIRGLPPARIREILGGAVLLDAGAARALEELGFTDLTGCRVGAAVPLNAGAEKLTAPAFAGAYADGFMPYVFNRLESVRTLNPIAGSREISAIVDHDLKRLAPGVVLFENALGGRVAILPYAIQGVEADLSHLICYHRRAQLKAVFDWMGTDAFPAWLEAPADVGVHLWDDAQNLTVCLTNLSYDVAESCVLELPDPSWKPDHATWLGPDGAREPLAGRITAAAGDSRTAWRLALPLRPFDPVVVMVRSPQS